MKCSYIHYTRMPSTSLWDLKSFLRVEVFVGSSSSSRGMSTGRVPVAEASCSDEPARTGPVTSSIEVRDSGRGSATVDKEAHGDMGKYVMDGVGDSGSV